MAEKKIGGRIYKYDPLPAWEAYDALMLLLDVVGPASSLLEAVIVTNEEHRKVVMVAAMAAAIRQRNDKAMRELVLTIVENARCDGERCVIGVKPSGLDEMLQVAIWGCEVEFADFFAGAAVKEIGNLTRMALTLFQKQNS